MNTPKLGFSDLTGHVYILIGKEKIDVTLEFELIAKAKEILKQNKRRNESNCN